MCLEKSGVSTLRRGKWSPVVFCVVTTAAAAFLAACSSETSQDQRDSTTRISEDYAGTPVEEWRPIEKMLNEGLMRLKYRDKSGLYELEFEYLRDEKTYDEYLTMGEIRWASMDTINHLEVNDVHFYDDDSAWVEATYVFDSPTQGRSETPDEFMVYKHNGRWIKPFVSIIDNQLLYEKTIEDARKAALEEAQGDG